MKRFLIVLTILILTSCSPKSENAHTDEKSLTSESERIDEFISQTMNDFEIGGAIGIGIVKEGEIVMEKAFGYRDVSRKLPATAETPFYIASITKSFMGTLAVLLDETEEVNIDDPLVKSLGFTLPKDINIEDKTIEDLFTHTSGIGNPAVGIKTAYKGNFSETEIYKDLENLSYPISQGYRYSNLGYIIGALIFKQKLGDDWKQLLKSRLLEPLKMSKTSARISDFTLDEIAKPHMLSEGVMKVGPFLKQDDTMHAAGGILTTVGDMNKWMNFHLNNGQALLSEEALDHIHSDLVGFYEKRGTLNSYGYGMGWNQADWNEYEITWHGGGYPGYRSLCLLSREENLGITILMNQESPAMNLIVDFLLGCFLEISDFETFISDRKDLITSRWKRYQFVRDSILNEGNKIYRFTRKAAEYEGVYLNEELGEVVVKSEQSSVKFTMGNLTFNTNYTGDDSFFYFSDADQLFGTIDFYTQKIGDDISSLDFSGLEFKKINERSNN
ncbi:MAG: serine hydrolase domain-containing protein [Ekhidna sp.]